MGYGEKGDSSSNKSIPQILRAMAEPKPMVIMSTIPNPNTHESTKEILGILTQYNHTSLQLEE